MRVVSKSIISCLTQLIDNGTHVYLRGMLEYAKVVRAYGDLYMSKTMTITERVRAASYVCFFFRYWRSYILFTSGQTVKK